MNKQFIQRAASKAIRMLGLSALVMSLGALGLTSCSDDDDNTPRPGDGQKIAAILKDNTSYWQGVARGVEAEAKAQGLTAEFFYTDRDADKGFYVIFAANGTAVNCALTALKQRDKFATLAAFDVTAEILQGLSDRYVVNICAQNTYGMGSGAVKAIVTPNAEAKQYLDTKNISLANVGSAEVEPYLNGIALPELPKIDRSLMTGTFISTSVSFPGMPVAMEETLTKVE